MSGQIAVNEYQFAQSYSNLKDAAARMEGGQLTMTSSESASNSPAMYAFSKRVHEFEGVIQSYKSILERDINSLYKVSQEFMDVDNKLADMHKHRFPYEKK